MDSYKKRKQVQKWKENLDKNMWTSNGEWSSGE